MSALTHRDIPWGGGAPTPASDDPIAILADCGLATITAPVDHAALDAGLRQLRGLLADAEPIRRATVRSALIDRLRAARVSGAAALADAAIGRGTTPEHTDETAALVTDDEPWPDRVDGARLLDETAALISRHVVLTSAQADAVALWVVGAHVIDVLSVMPILLIAAPTMRAGKTTLLMLLSALVPRALVASNITGAVLVRLIARYQPTMLLDEADTWLRSDDADMRGVVNAGEYRQTAYVYRCAPDTHEPQVIPCFAARALAMIGRPAGTIVDRSIPIALRRKRPDERVERMRLDTLRADHQTRRQQWRRWADDTREAIRETAASLPEQAIPADVQSDRARGHWRPLLAIADQLGGDWPQRGRVAASELSGGEAEDTEAAVELLRDIRAIVAERDDDATIGSADLLAALLALEDRPWREWRRGQPMSARGLARLLGPLGIHPERHLRTARGYRIDAIHEAIARYLPAHVAMCHTANVSGPDRPERMCHTDPTRDTYEKPKTPMNTGVGDTCTHRSALEAPYGRIIS